MATRTSGRRRRRTTQRHDGDVCHICNYLFPSPALYEPSKYEAILLRHISACSAKNDPQPPKTASDRPLIENNVAAKQKEKPVFKSAHNQTPPFPARPQVEEPILVDKESRPNVSQCYRNTSDLTVDIAADDQTTAPSSATPDLISSSDADTINTHANLPGDIPPESPTQSGQLSSERSHYAQCPICSKVFVPPKGYMFDPGAFEMKIVNHVTRCSKNPSPKVSPTKPPATKQSKGIKKKKKNGGKAKGKRGNLVNGHYSHESSGTNMKSRRVVSKPRTAKRKRAVSPVSIDPGHLLAQTWWKKTRAPPVKKEFRPRRDEVKFDLQACVVAAMEENGDALDPSRRSGRKASEQELQFACPVCRQPFKSSWLGPVTEEAMKRHVVRCQAKNESVSLADGEGDGRENTSTGVPIEKRIRRELTNEERAHVAAGHAMRASSLMPFIAGDCQEALDDVFFNDG